MPRNKIQDLRNHLFMQLEKLSEDELTIEQMDKEIKRTDAMCQIASHIIQSAKVEVDFLRMAGSDGTGSGFFKIDAPK